MEYQGNSAAEKTTPTHTYENPSKCNIAIIICNIMIRVYS
jgi:hypothetical protein